MPASILHLGWLIPLGPGHLEGDDLAQRHRPGSVGFAIDGFGPKVFAYFRNRQGASVTQGQLLSKAGDENGVTVVTASTGSTTSFASSSAISLTASAHVGSMLLITSNASGEGAAPAGEISVIVSNTSASIQVDPDYAFSTAVANGDTGNIISTFNIELSTGDNNIAVYGVVVAENGVGDNNFGWAQQFGLCPVTVYSSLSANVGQALIASSQVQGEVIAASNSVVNTALRVIGYVPGSVSSALYAGTNRAASFLQLGYAMGPISTWA